MTDKQINAAIAEACGWRKEDGVYMWTANGIDCTCNELWDWANDLNAMHEAEKVLDVSCRLNYPIKLLRVLYELGNEFTWYGSGTFPHITATARQRAEAFLRTLGKWDDQSGDATEMVKEVQK